MEKKSANSFASDISNFLFVMISMLNYTIQNIIRERSHLADDESVGNEMGLLGNDVRCLNIQ
jgi:hypothetical protein